MISFILPPNEYGCVYVSLSEPANDLQRIIFSDEARFDLGGHINKQNCRIWGTENPHAYFESRRSLNESLYGADFGPEA